MDSDTKKLIRSVVRRVHPGAGLRMRMELFLSPGISKQPRGCVLPFSTACCSAHLRATPLSVLTVAAPAAAPAAALIDLFTSHPFERQRNSDSLKALNSYVEQVARGITPRSASVEFWVKDGESLSRIDALLPSTGSLGPLFYAFALITEEELQAGAGGRDDVADTNFLEWLRDTVFEAVKIAEQHESLKLRIRESRANIEFKYQLASLQVRL
jgi:Domain of unknown function (DUF4460)